MGAIPYQAWWEACVDAILADMGAAVESSLWAELSAVAHFPKPLLVAKFDTRPGTIGNSLLLAEW
jgi:hypothetical protein